MTFLNIRPSRVLAKIRSGGVAVSVKSNLADPRVTDIIGRSGFDCFWTCMEHVPNSITVVENQIRAAKVHDMDTIVRVRRGSYSDLILPLEMDAAGVMVPHVMNAEQARQIVYHTKFHPIGRRPMDGGNADGAFTTIPAADYARQINEQRFVMLQIEDPEAMEQLEDIAQIEGVDALMFGPGDFSHALGIAGQLNAPRVEFARRRVADVCNQYQKFAATTGPLERLEELIAMGYQFINLGGDVPILADYFTKTHAAASDIINSAKCGPNDVKGPF